MIVLLILTLIRNISTSSQNAHNQLLKSGSIHCKPVFARRFIVCQCLPGAPHEGRREIMIPGGDKYDRYTFLVR